MILLISAKIDLFRLITAWDRLRFRIRNRFFKFDGEISDYLLEFFVFVQKTLLFFGDILGFKSLVTEFEKLITPFVVLSLGYLVFGTEFVDFDLPLKPSKTSRNFSWLVHFRLFIAAPWAGEPILS